MRALIQRVSQASVQINGETHASIQQGLLVLLGIEHADSLVDIETLTKKIVQLRIFADKDGLMNKSLIDIDGDLLLISQFTLYADTKKGNRPSFIKAAPPSMAIPYYEAFIHSCRQMLGNEKVKTGIFGADMSVSLINEGPVTIWLDTKKTG